MKQVFKDIAQQTFIAAFKGFANTIIAAYKQILINRKIKQAKKLNKQTGKPYYVLLDGNGKPYTVNHHEANVLAVWGYFPHKPIRRDKSMSKRERGKQYFLQRELLNSCIYSTLNS